MQKTKRGWAGEAQRLVGGGERVKDSLCFTQGGQDKKTPTVEARETELGNKKAQLQRK